METDKKYRSDITTAINDRLEYMTGKHNKVLFVRMDVKFPDGYVHNGRNSEIVQFIKNLKEWFSDKKNKIHYVWVRERVSSAVPHYHFVLLVNGSLMQGTSNLFKKAESLWDTILCGEYDGLIDYCCHEYKGRPGSSKVMIKRPSSDADGQKLVDQQNKYKSSYEKAMKRGEYLAKEFSKGSAPYKIREFGCSQLIVENTQKNEEK